VAGVNQYQEDNESDILLRWLDRRLVALHRLRNPSDHALAERIITVLRRLVAETASSSAADRARVRAAVHYFILRRRAARALTEDARVVVDILRSTPGGGRRPASRTRREPAHRAVR
jgi:hypothetical protein